MVANNVKGYIDRKSPDQASEFHMWRAVCTIHCQGLAWGALLYVLWIRAFAGTRHVVFACCVAAALSRGDVEMMWSGGRPVFQVVPSTLCLDCMVA